MDVDDRIREAVREDRLPDPSAQFHSRVMASLPDRAGKARWAIPAFPILLRFGAIALVVLLVAAAVGLPVLLSRPGAAAPAGPSQSPNSTQIAVSTATPTDQATASPEPSGAAPSPSPTPTAVASSTPSPWFSPTGTMTTTDNGLAVRLLDGRVLIIGSAATSPEIYDPKTGNFSKTGSMTTDRSGATATLLLDGRVLVAGGENDTATLASAELYDPRTGKFSPTGSMTTPREGHSATLLPDGRVLIAGGWIYSTAMTNPAALAMAYRPGSGGRETISETGVAPPDLTSAELYDPKTGMFSPTGSMSNGRDEQTATLLQDGRVLVAGGSDASGEGLPQSSAELYEPKTGTFSPTGAMTSPRWYHTATLLSNGRVLIAGGEGLGPNLASAELYDPKTGTFSATGSMSQARSDHTATLLPNGRVLIAGGDTFGQSPASISTLASAEIYDPRTGTFSPAGSMNSPRLRQTATLLLDGRVLIAGGWLYPSGSRGPGEGLASAELYQP